MPHARWLTRTDATNTSLYITYFIYHPLILVWIPRKDTFSLINILFYLRNNINNLFSYRCIKVKPIYKLYNPRSDSLLWNDLKLLVYDFKRFKNYSVWYNASVVLGHRVLYGKATSRVIYTIWKLKIIWRPIGCFASTLSCVTGAVKDRTSTGRPRVMHARDDNCIQLPIQACEQNLFPTWNTTDINVSSKKARNWLHCHDLAARRLENGVVLPPMNRKLRLQWARTHIRLTNRKW